MDISVVVPLYNEDESIPELYAWIERVMTENKFSYEVIFVNDGSTDRSWDVITELAEKSEHVKGIKFRRNYGKSPALYCGFKEAQGDVVITMDADLQDSPDDNQNVRLCGGICLYGGVPPDCRDRLFSGPECGRDLGAFSACSRHHSVLDVFPAP